MTREELLAAVTAERFGEPVRTDRHRFAGNIYAIVAEFAATPPPVREGLGRHCQYAACEYEALRYVDGFALCGVHERKHRSEAAS